VRDSSTGKLWEDEPVATVETTESGKEQVTAIGVSSGLISGERINPFDHPRLIINDFHLAEKIIHHAIRSLFNSSGLSLSPIVVIHVVEDLEGGITPVECRALQEAVEGAGARRVYFWEGRELTDSELIEGAYESST